MSVLCIVTGNLISLISGYFGSFELRKLVIKDDSLNLLHVDTLPVPETPEKNLMKLRRK